MDRKETATYLHKQGFNCAQSVACSFCNVMGADAETTFRLAEGFGFGMGSMGTCGAVSAMAMVVGMKISDGDLDAPKTKKECYAMMKKLSQEFEEINGSIMCSELKSSGNDNRKSCDELIQCAAELLDKHLLGL